MPAYTFTTLSPWDFELLVRDLLQAELGVRLESFTHGRDRGIDLRHSRGRSAALIVQAKHYANSSWSDLRRSLELEIPKVRALGPERYIIATSLALTPDRKEWIANAFDPFCGSPSDIWGAEDINNSLGRNQAIERQHFKLWLTSISVLERILHSAVFSEQESELRHLQDRISRFVSNESVPRSLGILEDQGFCVITGVPGIGKTTLAEMLVIDHLERGYECYRIWNDIAEARRVYSERAKQLFYYDDFLGRTALQRTDRNEDERLLRFIRDVARSEKHKLVLTSREYILNQAAATLEGLARADLEPSRCVVDLSDYTPRIRAQILYNHLYYSGIPHSHVESIVSTKAYRAIVGHRNYSPRLIEAMTDLLNVREISPSQYPPAFLETLTNPRQLWEIAYSSHLTPAAQNVLLVTTSLPDEADLGDAAHAFERLHEDRSARYGQPRSPYDWNRALKELEGTFIAVGTTHGAVTLRFHNPSIRDFMENHLRANEADGQDLVATAVFPNQILRLHGILGHRDSPSAMSMLERYTVLYEARSGVFTLRRFGNDVRRERVPQSPIARFVAALPILLDLPQSQIQNHLAGMVDRIYAYLATPAADRTEITSLLRKIVHGSVPTVDTSHDLYRRAVEAAFSDFDPELIDPVDYEALVDFARDYPRDLRSGDYALLEHHFAAFEASELSHIRHESDADSKISFYDQLEGIASGLGRELSLSRAEVLEDVEERQEDEEDDESYIGRSGGSEDRMSDSDLDNMFETLIN